MVCKWFFHPVVEVVFLLLFAVGVSACGTSTGGGGSPACQGNYVPTQPAGMTLTYYQGNAPATLQVSAQTTLIVRARSGLGEEFYVAQAPSGGGMLPMPGDVAKRLGDIGLVALAPQAVWKQALEWLAWEVYVNGGALFQSYYDGNGLTGDTKTLVQEYGLNPCLMV
jgi:hypothetical protein